MKILKCLSCFFIILMAPLSLFANSPDKSLSDDSIMVADFYKLDPLNPFSLPSVSIYRMPYDRNDIINGTGKHKDKYLSSSQFNPIINSYGINWEKPIYEEYISWGLNLDTTYNFAFEDAHVSADFITSFKLRYPVYLKHICHASAYLGFGVGVSPLIVSVSGANMTKEIEDFVGVVIPEDMIFNKKTTMRLGGVGEILGGIEIYPAILKFFSLYVEYKVRGRYYPKISYSVNSMFRSGNISADQIEKDKKMFYTDQFSYYTSQIAVGIRTTF